MTEAEEPYWFAERALRNMLAIAEELGDDLVSARPELPGANSAFGLITHCLGVVEYWVGQLIAGRTIERDREAEFEATGSVDELRGAVTRGLDRMRSDLTSFEPQAAPRMESDPRFQGPERYLTQNGVLLHVLEELHQHHGQLEVLRDVLRRTAEPEFAPSLDWLRAKQGVKWRRPGPERLPAWVADMDFPIAEPIRAAIAAAVDRGDLGYPDWPPQHPLAEPFAARMAARYGWSPDPGHVRGLTDLIQGLQIVTERASSPGDGVVLTVPNYPPFLASVPRQGRRIVPLHLEADGDSWRWDLERLERDLVTGGASLLLLVNPHNPSGRVFSRGELEGLADVALRHDLLVISDEIHAELTYDGHEHVPFASLSPEIARRTVTVTSASKAFNIAGLRCAVAHVGPDELRARWDAQPPDLHGAVNVLGVEATRAAWEHGEKWLQGVRAHLTAQRELIGTRLAGVPVRYRPPEATYLAWLEFAGAGLPGDAAEFFRRAGVELSPGPEFGGRPDQVRLNFATSRDVLEQVLDRMVSAVRGLR